MSQWHEDQAIGERELERWRKEREGLDARLVLLTAVANAARKIRLGYERELPVIRGGAELDSALAALDAAGGEGKR